MYQFISKNENDTIEFAKKLAATLEKGDVIVLSGELGAGKTKFTEGILTYFNLQDEISSPTFTIVNEYNAKNVDIYHFDVYRLADTDEFYAMGGEDYFDNGICIIEWGEIIESILPTDYLKINFSKADKDEKYRKLDFEIHGNKLKEKISKLF